MSEPFVGEIKMFAGTFSPRGWAQCDGQLLAISQNSALFSLLGTIYGGDGRTTFGLPDMRGRIPVHAGSGPGLASRNIGTKSGSEDVTLTVANVPSHTHGVSQPAQGNVLKFAQAASDQASPDGNSIAAPRGGEERFAVSHTGDTLHADTVVVDGTLGPTGGGQSHPNVPPFQCVNFIIALLGIYPSRN